MPAAPFNRPPCVTYEADVTVRVTALPVVGYDSSPFADREASVRLRVVVEGQDLEASARAIAHAIAGAKEMIEDTVKPGHGSATPLHT